MEKILVTGAGGFIGHHLVRFLKKKGYWVRGVDIKEPEFSPKDEADEFFLLDLRDFNNCLKATEEIDKVYNLAANMGGIGFITSVKADVMKDNVLINTNMAEASRINGIKRLFFSSSACIYPTYKQTDPNLTALKEKDAYPADPDNEYGWEKLYSERLYQAYHKDYGLEVRIARYHNIFGPEGTYDGGREKAPAALCRKIALTKDGDEIEVWGDGKQSRSFCYIDDCLEGTYRLMESDYKEPLNIGSDRLVTINEMIEIISDIAGKNIKKRYLLDKPQGVRGRNSDNMLCKSVLGWTPQITLEQGLKKTYHWINSELNKKSGFVFAKIENPLPTEPIFTRSVNPTTLINNRTKIGIAGLGFVGGAVKNWFEKENSPIFTYDKYKNIGSIENLNKAKIIFLCLPTPFIENNGFDDSALVEVLSQIKDSKIIVIKSTVLPGSTNNYQKRFPQHKFLVNPEFLIAKTAINDFLNPERQIVGYTRESKDITKDILNILPKAPIEKIVKAEEAEMIKYFGNTFLANRVIFANQIYDICQKAGIDYEVVKECAGTDSRIGWSHFDIFHDGYRGYGGACLPKDTKAFIQFAEKLGVDNRLFKILEAINKDLLNGNQNQER